MKKTSLKDPVLIPGYGWEVDLDENTCDAETLAYLDASDEEQAMPLGKWKALYAVRVKEGYYEKREAKRQAILTDPRLQDINDVNVWLKTYAELEAE